MPYIVATTTDTNGPDENDLVVLGSYRTLDDAKVAVNNLSSLVVEGTYKQVTIYQIDPVKNKIYTFYKKDLEEVHERQQRTTAGVRRGGHMQIAPPHAQKNRSLQQQQRVFSRELHGSYLAKPSSKIEFKPPITDDMPPMSESAGNVPLPYPEQIKKESTLNVSIQPK